MSTTRFLLPLILALATCWASNPIFDDVPPQFVQETLDDLPNFRLPEDIRPKAYDIILAPVFNTSDNNNFTFTGRSVITLEVVNATSRITFHAKDLNIYGIELNDLLSNESISIKDEYVIKNEQKDFVTLVLETTLNKGFPLTLSLNFTGKLNDELRGFYRSSYKNENDETVWLGTTQFEPVGARQAFPCWDEPAIKANFTITIITPKDSPVKYHAISNMKIDEEQSLDEKTVFNMSPPISSYLVAFVVSNYKNNTNNDFTVWTKPHAIDSTDFALEIGQEVLKELEIYTGINYKEHQEMQKMDQISIPDFSAGAMENWGLVTYRESALLYTKNKTTTESKQSIATVISHEFAHQWFGNLVTCAWWDYIWLNEGFATFFQYFITEKVVKEKLSEDWRLMEQFAIKNLQASAFVVDANIKTRALNPKVSVKTPSQISSLFDDIAYKKGASIIRMMQHMLGDEVFRNGLNNYLTRYSFDAVNSDNLFEAIQENVTEKVSNTLENITLTTIMENWVKEPGYPVVTVTRNKLDINLKQTRFLLSQPTNPDTTEWYIPINYVQQDAIDEVQGPYLLKPGQELNITNVANETSWVLLNIDQTGYYRVNYDEASWGVLTAYLKTDNYENITAVNRAQLIDDALNLARGEYLKYNVALSITTYLSKETDYIPWYAATRAFNYLDTVLQDQKADYYKYVANKIQTFAQSIGSIYEIAHNGTHVEKLANVLALNTACKYGLETCNKFASDELKKYLNNEITLPTDLRRGILCAGLRSANNETLQKALQKHKNVTDEDEKADILVGLGCITSDEIVNEFLKSRLGTDFLLDALNSVCTGNVGSFNVLIKFIVQHIAEIEKANLSGLTAHLNKLANIITTDEQYMQIASLIAHLQLEDVQEAPINAGLTNALENINWIKRHREEVVKWIQEVGNKPEPEPTPEPDSASSLTLTFFLVIVSVLLTRL